MDDTLLMNAGLSTTGVAILLLVYRLVKSVQGKKLVSSCCGRKAELGFDVKPMTPQPPPQIVVRTPLESLPCRVGFEPHQNPPKKGTDGQLDGDQK